MSNPTRDDLILLYVADALDEDERARAEALIRSGDPDVLAAVDRAEQLLAMLPLALEPKLPSRHVGSELLERARRSAAPDDGHETEHESVRPPSRFSWRHPAWLAAAAAGLLAIVTTGQAWRLHRQMEDTRVELVSAAAAARARAAARGEEVSRVIRDRGELEARVATLESEIAGLRATNEGLAEQSSALSDRLVSERNALGAAEAEAAAARSRAGELDAVAAFEQQRVADLEDTLGAEKRRLAAELATARRALELVRSPESAAVDLVPPAPDLPGRAAVFWDRDWRHCYLVVHDLPPTADGSRYVLWLETDGGRAVRVTEIAIAPDQREVEVVAALPPDVRPVSRTWISREPGRGARTPAGPPVLIEPAPDEPEDDSRPKRRRRGYGPRRAS